MVRTKKWPKSRLGEWVTDILTILRRLPCRSITEQTTAKFSPLVLYNKKVKIFFQNRLCSATKIMIYIYKTKQSTALAVDNSEMDVIGL